MLVRRASKNVRSHLEIEIQSGLLGCGSTWDHLQAQNWEAQGVHAPLKPHLEPVLLLHGEQNVPGSRNNSWSPVSTRAPASFRRCLRFCGSSINSISVCETKSGGSEAGGQGEMLHGHPSSLQRALGRAWGWECHCCAIPAGNWGGNALGWEQQSCCGLPWITGICCSSQTWDRGCFPAGSQGSAAGCARSSWELGNPLRRRLWDHPGCPLRISNATAGSSCWERLGKGPEPPP